MEKDPDVIIIGGGPAYQQLLCLCDGDRGYSNGL